MRTAWREPDTSIQTELQQRPIQVQGLVDVRRIDAAIHAISRNLVHVAVSTMLHFLAWAIGAVETWLGLWLMGYPSTFPRLSP